MAPRRFFGSADRVAQFRTRRPQLATQPVHAVAESRHVLDTPLLTVKDVAGRLSVSPKRVYGLIYEQGLPVRWIGRAIRIHPGELNDWTLCRHGEVKVAPDSSTGQLHSLKQTERA